MDEEKDGRMTPTEMVMAEMKAEIEKLKLIASSWKEEAEIKDEHVQLLKKQLEVAKDALAKIKSENKPVSGSGGIESKEYWMAQEIKSRMMAFHCLNEIESIGKGGV